MDAVTAPSQTTARPKSTGAASDYTTFLKMLTTQMQNQDPLNPIESTDFAIQLATFSGVEQQVQTNQLLSGLAAQFSLLGMAQLSGWVGQEARTTADVWFDGRAIALTPDAAPAADNLVLNVTGCIGKAGVA